MTKALQVVANILQVGLALGVLGAMIRGRFIKRFPCFFFYVCFQVCEAAFRWLLFWKGTAAAYYYGYWRTQIFDMAFSFIAIGESWLHVFRAFLALAWFRVVAGSGAAIMLGCCWWAVWRHPRLDHDWLLATILQLDLTFTFVPVVASILYFWLVKFFRIPAYKRESGVILGFMIAHGFSLTAVGFRTVIGMSGKILGIRASNLASWVPVVGYLVCELIWLLTFVGRVEEPIERGRLLTVEQINERLGEYLAVFGQNSTVE